MANKPHKAIMKPDEVFTSTFVFSLKKHKEILVLGIGTFRVTKRKAVKMFIPARGITRVPARKKIQFRASATLKKLVI